MRLYRFDSAAGREIDAFGSSGAVLTRILRLSGEAQLSCIYLAPGGVIGYHQAASPQLFLVVQGDGWIQGEAHEKRKIAAGEAAHWGKGEWHEAGSDRGLTAIVVEAEGLEPERFMPAA